MTSVHLRSAVASLPAYVPGSRPETDDVAKLSSNELPYPPHPQVAAAIVEAATTTNRYPEMTGDTLVTTLAARHQVSPAQVVVGNGSVALIQHLLDTVCDEGDDVVMPWRSFEAYPICVAVAGAQAVKVPVTTDGRHDIPALLAAITPRTRVLLACSPNNPTGPALTTRELEELLAGTPQDVLIMLDEAYLEFVTDPDVPNGLDYLADHPNLVVSRTFSKAHALAGMRVGYLVGEPGIIGAIRSVSTPFGVNSAAQSAALAACDAEVLAETERRCAVVVSERQRVLAALRAQGWEIPDPQGNFCWLGVGDDAVALAEHFRAAKILVRPFAGEGVRISLGTPAENDRLITAAGAYRGE